MNKDMELSLLRDIIVIFGLSIVVLLFCHWSRIPLIVGFLITGILSGPYGFKLVYSPPEVQKLAEVGIIVLLFTVGLEVSIKKILENIRYFFLGGTLQVLITTLGGIAAALLCGRSLGEGVFLGFMISLSSTAIVMKLLQDKGQINTPYAKLILPILIFQDVIAVPMILITPVLAGEMPTVEFHQLLSIGGGLVFFIFTFLAAMWFVPKLLFYVAKTRSHELFLLTLLMICLSVAWIASTVGLSLPLGAFLAGLIISESEYGSEAIGDIIPFRDIFTSFFFVSIGMLLDINFLLTHPATILSVTASVLLLKCFAGAVTTLILGMPIRTAVMTGLSLSQIGEFSFVLATFGSTYGMGNSFLNQIFLSVAIISMGATPFLTRLGTPIINLFFKLPLPEKFASGLKSDLSEKEKKLQNHVVIIGYGLAGKHLARSVRIAKVPYIILDLNPEIVEIEQKKGEPIHFGDASRENVLQHVHVDKANMIAVLVNDPAASLRIVDQVRKLSPSAHIIVRTQFQKHVKRMFHLGANDVISDDFGSSIEIFTRVLRHYKTPQLQIQKIIKDIHAEGYELLRNEFIETTIFSGIKDHIIDVSSNAYVVAKESPVLDQSFSQSQIRTKYGLTILLIRRNNTTIYNIGPETKLQEGDTVVVIGPKENVLKGKELFQP